MFRFLFLALIPVLSVHAQIDSSRLHQFPEPIVGVSLGASATEGRVRLQSGKSYLVDLITGEYRPIEASLAPLPMPAAQMNAADTGYFDGKATFRLLQINRSRKATRADRFLIRTAPGGGASEVLRQIDTWGNELPIPVQWKLELRNEQKNIYQAFFFPTHTPEEYEVLAFRGGDNDPHVMELYRLTPSKNTFLRQDNWQVRIQDPGVPVRRMALSPGRGFAVDLTRNRIYSVRDARNYPIRGAYGQEPGTPFNDVSFIGDRYLVHDHRLYDLRTGKFEMEVHGLQHAIGQTTPDEAVVLAAVNGGRSLRLIWVKENRSRLIVDPTERATGAALAELRQGVEKNVPPGWSPRLVKSEYGDWMATQDVDSALFFWTDRNSGSAPPVLEVEGQAPRPFSLYKTIGGNRIWMLSTRINSVRPVFKFRQGEEYVTPTDLMYRGGPTPAGRALERLIADLERGTAAGGMQRESPEKTTAEDWQSFYGMSNKTYGIGMYVYCPGGIDTLRSRLTLTENNTRNLIAEAKGPREYDPKTGIAYYQIQFQTPAGSNGGMIQANLVAKDGKGSCINRFLVMQRDRKR